MSPKLKYSGMVLLVANLILHTACRPSSGAELNRIPRNGEEEIMVLTTSDGIEYRTFTREGKEIICRLNSRGYLTEVERDNPHASTLENGILRPVRDVFFRINESSKPFEKRVWGSVSQECGQLAKEILEVDPRYTQLKDYFSRNYDSIRD